MTENRNAAALAGANGAENGLAPQQIHIEHTRDTQVSSPTIATAGAETSTTAVCAFPGIPETLHRAALPMPGNGATKRLSPHQIREATRQFLRPYAISGREAAETAFLILALNPPPVEIAENVLRQEYQRAIASALEAIHSKQPYCGSYHDRALETAVVASFWERLKELGVTSSLKGGQA